MRVTTKGRYALRAMINLALAPKNKPKPIKIIAAEEHMSPEFLEQIFFKLKKAGVIDSIRGPGGGFVLHQNPDEISIRSVFAAVDEGLELAPCVSDAEEDEACSQAENCLMYGVWQEASEQINAYFDSVTLQKIIENAGELPNQDLFADESVSLG